MERRHFLILASGLSATGLIGGALWWRPWSRHTVAKRGRGRVALARDERVIQAQRRVDPLRLQQMVQQAICGATGLVHPRQAWQSLFSSQDVVGIKLNCLAGPLLSPHPALVQVLVAGLRSAGLEDRQILIWERSEQELRRAGYTINRGDKPGPLVLATDSPGFGYRKDSETTGDYQGRFTTILERTTAHLSVGVLKDHDISGVGIGMKNYYGAIDNPHEYHHDQCSPFIADICASHYLGKRLRLTVADGLWAQCHGGPAYAAGWNWPWAGILASTDPVALDATGAAILDRRRRHLGLPSLGPKGAPPRFLRAGAIRGLGIDDLSRIRLVGV